MYIKDPKDYNIDKNVYCLAHTHQYYFRRKTPRKPIQAMYIQTDGAESVLKEGRGIKSYLMSHLRGVWDNKAGQFVHNNVTPLLAKIKRKWNDSAEWLGDKTAKPRAFLRRIVPNARQVWAASKKAVEVTGAKIKAAVNTVRETPQKIRNRFTERKNATVRWFKREPKVVTSFAAIEIVPEDVSASSVNDIQETPSHTDSPNRSSNAQSHDARFMNSVQEEVLRQDQPRQDNNRFDSGRDANEALPISAMLTTRRAGLVIGNNTAVEVPSSSALTGITPNEKLAASYECLHQSYRHHSFWGASGIMMLVISILCAVISGLYLVSLAPAWIYPRFGPLFSCLVITILSFLGAGIFGLILLERWEANANICKSLFPYEMLFEGRYRCNELYLRSRRSTHPHEDSLRRAARSRCVDRDGILFGWGIGAMCVSMCCLGLAIFLGLRWKKVRQRRKKVIP